MKQLVDYSINIFNPKIFVVIIKDKYERGMTFCRAQEFYESPNPKFRGKGFSIWEYMDWYAKKNKRGFSYAHDWSGFNIPVKVIVDCYKKHWMTEDDPSLFETPYDEVLYKIVSGIADKVGYSNCIDGYIIATDKTSGTLFEHEICHARYCAEPKYRKLVNQVTNRFKKALPIQYKILRKNILNMGYAPKVVDDEIQAYMQYGFDDPKFRNNLELSVLRSISKMYVDALKKL